MNIFGQTLEIKRGFRISISRNKQEDKYVKTETWRKPFLQTIPISKCWIFLTQEGSFLFILFISHGICEIGRLALKWEDYSIFHWGVIIKKPHTQVVFSHHNFVRITVFISMSQMENSVLIEMPCSKSHNHK